MDQYLLAAWRRQTLASETTTVETGSAGHMMQEIFLRSERQSNRIGKQLLRAACGCYSWGIG
jgi:hypothetical protein